MPLDMSAAQPVMLTKRDDIARRVLAVLVGALVVAGAAQVSIPLPGTLVPLTLQPMAVLLVGGLLGPSLGAASMILYLAMGAAGLPVFTPSALLLPGVARLLGPTGGYLLAYPVAAWVAGWTTDTNRLTFAAVPWSVRVTLGVVAGLALIHLGGWAQLALLTGSIRAAAQVGFAPFLLGDLIKIAVLVPVLTKITPTIRARL